MRWKMAVIILLLTLLLAGCAGTPQNQVAKVQPTVTRFPPTAYPTALTPITPTTIPSYTPTSPASSIYYMIVLDASAQMNESFAGRTKWEAARESAQAIVDGLELGANYGLVAIGGSATTEGIDPCDEPSVARTPFSARINVSDQLTRLQPAGGGSLYSAFFLARRQFEGLPANMIKTLIVITDGVDECPSQNEWLGLEGLFKVTDKAGLDFHSEIMVLADRLDSQTQDVVKRIDDSSAAVNFWLPSDNTVLQSTDETVLGNVKSYVDFARATRPTETPDSLGFTLTPESGLPTNTLSASSYTLTPIPGLQTNTVGPSSYTLTPRTGTATFTPTLTFTPIPRTATLTLTPTITRTPTPTQPPSVELLSSSYRTTGIGCQVDIVVKVSGSSATGSFHVMNSSNGPVGEVYQQEILPIGTYSNNIVSLSGNRPESYFHEVWFEFSGIQSNRLKNLKCPFVPTATPTP
jgi:von Willebrand factor type A domain